MSSHPIEIISPISFQVFQRSEHNKADIDLIGTPADDIQQVVEFRLSGGHGRFFSWQSDEVRDKHFKAIIREVPTGGPYKVELKTETADSAFVKA